jgi:hypothetical protein
MRMKLLPAGRPAGAGASADQYEPAMNLENERMLLSTSPARADKVRKALRRFRKKDVLQALQQKRRPQ